MGTKLIADTPTTCAAFEKAMGIAPEKTITSKKSTQEHKPEIV